jgi:hypothetical protein
MKRISILIFLLAIGLSACARNKPAPLGADAPADNVPNIVGSYAVNAFDPTGEEYGGTLTITEGGQPNEYKFQWLISGGIQEGTGTLAGNKLNFTKAEPTRISLARENTRSQLRVSFMVHAPLMAWIHLARKLHIQTRNR